jgi:23S rRNA pseudouridine1911/1915/1917 synthase
VNERLVQLLYQGEDEERLDKFLVACLPDFSRSRLQALIKAGLVTVDGHAVSKAGQILDHEAQIEVCIPPPEPSELIPESIPLDILFENQDFLVVNKPAGMVVHPAAGHTSGTLVHAALAHVPDIQGVGGKLRPGIVHRLDKDTSGLILIAKNDQAHRWLQSQFRDRKVDKTYLALVDGAPPTKQGRIEAAIGRDPAHRKKLAVVPPGKGRLAISEFRTLEAFSDHTLLEVHPITGRTHQIRLHLAYLGCPITGDSVYGRRKSSLPLTRHFLHAARLMIQLPSEKSPRVFEATLPVDLIKALNHLRSVTG